MMNRKSQAALEFIMTYGWAILVVLVAIGALAYFGVLNPDRFLPSKCTFQAGIACLDHKATITSLIINIQNSLGRDMTISRLTALQCTEIAAPNQSAILNGQTGTYTFCCGATCVPASLGNADSTKYSGQVNISYTLAGTTISHTNQGDITTRIE